MKKLSVILFIFLLVPSVMAQKAMQQPARPIHYINLYGKLGYAAMIDGLNAYTKDAQQPASFTLSTNRLIGGPGAGLGVGYELEYKWFRFNTGLEFNWLNSTSDYMFDVGRNLLSPHAMTYHYRFSSFREMRNIGNISLPILVGAQFSRYYFMIGVGLGYNVLGNYTTTRAAYEVTATDPTLIDPIGGNKGHGLGLFTIDRTNRYKGKWQLTQPDLTLMAEVGVDLDEWLQARVPRRRPRVTPGERLPFRKHHIHYRVSLFAEYGILNSNADKGIMPLLFDDSHKVEPTGTNTILGMGTQGSRLNHLFVGAKFTVSFEIPEKTQRPVPPPASYAELRIIDDATGAAIPLSALTIHNTQRNRTTMKTRILKQGTHRQKLTAATYQAVAIAQDYYPDTASFAISKAGDNVSVVLRLRHKPVFCVQVTNAETGQPVRARIEIRNRTTNQLHHTLTTDSLSGNANAILADTVAYTLHVNQIGFNSYRADITDLSQHMPIALRPIKKGDVFVVKNLFFATNQTRILKESEEALNELYQYLSQNSEVQILITGHTDNIGTDVANLTLSDGRANAVRSSLIQRGIAPERIAAEGRGESQPIDTNDTEEGRQHNRRVEILIR